MVFVELKRRGGRLSEAQAAMRDHLTACGFDYLCTDDASEAIEPSVCDEVDRGQTESRQKLEQSGVSFEPLPPETQAQMKEKLKAVGKEWASALDGRGKPASAALDEFGALLAAGEARK